MKKMRVYDRFHWAGVPGVRYPEEVPVPGDEVCGLGGFFTTQEVAMVLGVPRGSVHRLLLRAGVECRVLKRTGPGNSKVCWWNKDQVMRLKRSSN